MFRALSLVVLLTACAALAAPPADLLARAVEARSLAGFRVDAHLTVTGQEARDFTWWRRAGADGRFRTLVRFRAPEALAGEALLVDEVGGVPREAWLYFPRTHKVRHLDERLLASTLGGGPFGFLEVALSWGAQAQREVGKDAPCPGQKGQQCPMLVARGVPGCATQEEVLDAVHALPAQVDCLGPDRALLRRTTLSAFHATELKGKRAAWPTVITLEDTATHRVTRVEFRDVKADDALPEEAFTPAGLPTVPWLRAGRVGAGRWPGCVPECRRRSSRREVRAGHSGHPWPVGDGFLDRPWRVAGAAA